MAKTVSGVDAAYVKTSDGYVSVTRGEELPAGVDEAELKRLEGLGVFADPAAEPAGLPTRGTEVAPTPVHPADGVGLELVVDTTEAEKAAEPAKRTSK